MPSNVRLYWLLGLVASPYPLSYGFCLRLGLSCGFPRYPHRFCTTKKVTKMYQKAYHYMIRTFCCWQKCDMAILCDVAFLLYQVCTSAVKTDTRALLCKTPASISKYRTGAICYAAWCVTLAIFKSGVSFWWGGGGQPIQDLGLVHRHCDFGS